MNKAKQKNTNWKKDTKKSHTKTLIKPHSDQINTNQVGKKGQIDQYKFITVRFQMRTYYNRNQNIEI